MLNGGLFTRDFLIEGICEQEAWTSLDDVAVAAIRARLITLFSAFGKLKNPTEAETEKELIWPLLEAIGWSDIAVQQNLSVKRREDVPDALLFLPEGGIDGVIESLAAKGATIVTPVSEAPGGWSAEFADPDGYVLSLYQSEKAPRRRA